MMETRRDRTLASVPDGPRAPSRLTLAAVAVVIVTAEGVGLVQRSFARLAAVISARQTPSR